MLRNLIEIPLLLIGVIGQRFRTGQPLLDCFYQAVILLTTVGSQEPNPLTDGTKFFLISYLACAVGVFTDSAFQFGQTIVTGEL